MKTLIWLGLILVFFQNCSSGFSTPRSGAANFASAAACEGALKLTYQKTYYPLVTTTCSQCHITGGAGNGRFADGELNVAFGDFINVGYQKINQVASGSHYFPASAIPENMATLDSISPEWNSAYESYTTCMASTNENKNRHSLITTSKTAPSNWIPNNVPDNGIASYVTQTWDLETEVDEKNKNIFKGTVSIDLRPYYRNGLLIGVQFRNPKIKLKSGNTNQFFSVIGLNIGIDGSKTDLTTFDAVSAPITTETGSALAPGYTALYLYDSIGEGTLFDIRFDSIDPI